MHNRQPASLEDAFERALGAIRARVSASERSIAVAYSGGLDSAALLHLVKGYAATRDIAVFAFHVHHGLSPDANNWLSHCERECKRLDIRFEARRVTLAECARDGTEQAARLSRYAALGGLCRAHGVPLLLTAHHQDDQAETVLLQLLRGSGVAGLSGMENVNTAPDLLGDSSLMIGRPMLEFSRADLEQHVTRHGIAFVEDESNADERYARNALRHKVIPSLAGHFPGYQQRFARAAQHAQAAQRVMEEVAAEDMTECADGDCIDIPKLKQLSFDRMNNLLRYWFSLHGARMPSTAWLAEMRDQILEAREDAQVRLTHADCEVRRHRNRIFLTKRNDEARQDAPPLVFRWRGEAHIHFPAFGGRLYFDVADAGIDAAWLAARELQIGYRSGGEKLKPAPNRPTRSLKHHYQALDIPPWERARLPMVATGGHLLFAAGIGMNWLGSPPVDGLAIILRWEKDHI